MSRLPITIACGSYDRVQAIVTGEVEVKGCEVNVMSMGAEELFFRAYRNHEFDVCELSMSSYLVSVASGNAHYVAIPVFPSRVFRHSAIYIRADRGIDKPADLKGKRVGVPEYQMTAAMWVRGLLDDEYGVTPADFEWSSGGLHDANRPDKLKLQLNDTIRIQAIGTGETLDGLLAEGRLDALISARAPRCFEAGHPQIRRLFPDYRKASIDYFRKTGFHPIMHVIGVRRTLVDQHPWLANALFEAFLAAKNMAVEAMKDCGTLKVTLPFLDAELDDTFRIMGDDPWPYGVEENRKVLEAMLGYAHRHGTTPRRLAMAEVFAPGTLERFKV